MFAVIFIFAANCILTGNAQNYSVRLNNSYGNSSKEGRLEIYYSGVWGTVCDDLFTNNSARVACASLGFGYSGAFIGNRYGAGTGQIWLDDVNCNGTETGIQQCVHLPWGQHNCGHTEDVSIACGNALDYSVRLNNSYGNSSKEGRLEIYYSGVWGTVCDDEFTNNSAKVACASLGFGNYGKFIANRYGAGTGQIWLDGVNCTGTETGIEQCVHLPWGQHNCGHSEDVSISCDCISRYFNARTGHISSPNYPRAYANNLGCYSYITVATGQKVTITFQAFNTQPTYDFVQITCSSGNTYTSPQYSGSQIPPVLTISSCSSVRVYFYSDSSVIYSGFDLTYTITSDCPNSYFSGRTGQISSPNYPNAYGNYLDCSGYITVSYGQKITIAFLAFSTQPAYDYVTITCESGITYTSPAYSGSQIPAILTISSCTYVKIHFHTDGSTVYTGFSLAYNITSDCPNSYFSARTAQISSPNYPNAYSNYLDCSSYITVSSGEKITITFLAFSTQPSIDYVKITCESGSTYASPAYSGSQIPAALTITSCTYVKVYFHSDGSTAYTGFSLAYNVTSDCASRYYSGRTGQISSPNYPNAYSNNLDCSSFITVSSGQKITIEFLAFSTQPSNDYVTITCESGTTYSSAAYSGSQISAILKITSCTNVKVYFHTDGSTTYPGFNLAYNISSDCASRYFSGLTGQISSPNYPNAYDNYLDCSSYISVSPGKKITITFLAFYTQPSYDYVTITCDSGSVFTSPNYSGSQIPAALTITSCASVKVYFHTDGSSSYSGFNLTYSVTPDCTGFRNFSGPTGQISSPNYPNAYNNNLDCSNYITVSSGQSIIISFLSFNTQPSVDYVTISCQTGTAYIFQRYWGSEIPAVVKIGSCSPIQVFFHTDGSITYTGFSLTYNITSSKC